MPVINLQFTYWHIVAYCLYICIYIFIYTKYTRKIVQLLSASGTHNFNLGKSVLPIISHLSKVDYSLTNSYELVQSISEIPTADDYYMCSFDITGLYTNVPVDEAINIILNAIYSNSVTSHEGLSKAQLGKLLELVLNDSHFKFNDCLYKQISGLSMGSSVSPAIANIFLNTFE